jgi:DNA-binding CsgD family transcriptional regulator
MWVARGKSNPEIATILTIAPRTVQKHLEHIFAKLGVESRTAAARRALEVFSPRLGEV